MSYILKENIVWSLKDSEMQFPENQREKVQNILSCSKMAEIQKLNI